MDAIAICCPIKTLREERVVFVACWNHLCGGGIDTSFLSQQVAEMLPKAHIVVVFARGKLCHIKCMTSIYDAGFRTRTTQG